MADLSKFQKFTIERVHRSVIAGAKYNPRTISPAAKKKLQANLKRVGLLEPVIVNKKTGMRLVGGHQRLACLDVLEGSPDYTLDVSVVSLTEKQEREANLFLNNASAQGEWDLDLLAGMLPGLDLDNTGFEQVSLDIMFADTAHSAMFTPESQPAVSTALDELQAISAAKDEPAAPGDDGAAKRKASADAVAKMREKSKGMAVAEDTERYLVVICNSRKEREDLAERLCGDRDTRYLTTAQVLDKLK